MMDTREDEREGQSQSPLSNISASNYNSKLRRKFEESSTGSPSRLQDPINLNNLQSLNLRNQLFKRLKNFDK